MTVVNKREPENPWDGIKLIVGIKKYYTETGNAVDDTFTTCLLYTSDAADEL